MDPEEEFQCGFTSAYCGTSFAAGGGAVNEDGDDDSGGSGDEWKKDACPCKFMKVAYNVWTAAMMTPEVNGLQEIVKIERTDPKRLMKLDSYGYCALHYCAQKNHIRKMKVIMKHQKNPDLTGNGATALHRAAFSGSFEACKMLLAAGANPNLPDNSMKGSITPIQKAKMNGHSNIVALLLQYNAEDKDLPPEYLPAERSFTKENPVIPTESSTSTLQHTFSQSDSSLTVIGGSGSISGGISGGINTTNIGNSNSNGDNSNSNSNSNGEGNSKGSVLSGVPCQDCKSPTFAVYRRKTDRKLVCTICRYLI